jgi:hypothetical protein
LPASDCALHRHQLYTSTACAFPEQRRQLYLDGVLQPNTSVKLTMPASECSGPSPLSYHASAFSGQPQQLYLERCVAAEHDCEAEHMPVSECVGQRHRNVLDGVVYPTTSLERRASAPSSGNAGLERGDHENTRAG